MDSKSVIDVRRAAEDSLASGLHCAEAVVLALAQKQGIASDVLPKVATAFCSGMGRTCGTCGALTGAVMGISLAFGRTEAKASVEPTYRAVQRLVSQFESEFGSRECHKLLGCDLGTLRGRATYRRKNLRSRCVEYTGRAAEIAAAILLEEAPR